MTTEAETYKVQNSQSIHSQSRIYSPSPHNKSIAQGQRGSQQFRDPNQSGFSDYYVPASQRQALMTSIYKGIKNNDVSQILGKSGQNPNKSFLPSINPRGDEEGFDEKFEVHKNLTEMRRQFDITKALANKKEKELKLLQEESDQLREKQQELKGSSVGVIEVLRIRKQILDSFTEKEMSSKSENSKNSMEERSFQRKSYAYMHARLKRDILVYQKTIMSLAAEKNSIKQEIAIVDQRKIQTKQFTDQSQRMMDEVARTIEREKKVRDTRLQQIKAQIDSRQEVDRKREERLVKMMVIADHAMHDKDPQEKKWRQLLLVHKFVTKMLKDKMEREMKKFEVVEAAFQKIKTATGVAESEEIVSKFLSREQTYGELLSTIAESESKIEKLKKECENHGIQLQDLKQELVSLEMQQKKGKQGFTEQDLMKKFDSMEEKVQRTILLKRQIYNWCIRFLKKHEQITFPRTLPKKQQIRTDFKAKYDKEELDSLFKVVCDIFDAELLASQEYDVEAVLDDLNMTKPHQDNTQTQEFISRNMRIQPRLHHSKKSAEPASNPSEQSDDSDDDDSDSSQNKSLKIHGKVEGDEAESDGFNLSFGDSDSEANFNEEAEDEYVKALRGELKREQELVAKKKRLEKEAEKIKLAPPS